MNKFYWEWEERDVACMVNETFSCPNEECDGSIEGQFVDAKTEDVIAIRERGNPDALAFATQVYHAERIVKLLNLDARILYMKAHPPIIISKDDAQIIS